MAFTKEQNMAIDTEGQNIIVSAGAGSGKTAVLTARVIRKLSSGIDIDHLLVLTFTNEAAKEMKSRIRDAIIENNLTNQLDLLESSYITTFDSFALSLVKKYHYTLNISKNIKIIDKDIITIYKYKMLDIIFEEKYCNKEFDNLINSFCLKDDKNIKNFIINLSDKRDLMIDKYTYLNNYLKSYYTKKHLDELYDNYLNLIKNKIIALQQVYDELTNYINDDWIIKFDTYLKPLFKGTTYEEYELFKNVPTIRFPKIPEETTTIKENMKEIIEEIKQLLRFKNKDEIIKSISSTKEYINVIIEIINELDSKIIAYKNKHEAYEFNDISHMAIKIVKDNLDIQEELKTYFNEIMIDEYQDTSNIQEEFIKCK